MTNEQELREALKKLSDMYTHAWDRRDGCLVMPPGSVEQFEKAHSAARVALGKPLYGDLPGEDFDDEPDAALSQQEAKP